MAIRFPLALRINDGQTDRHVTGTASDLRFKRTAPGGFHSMSVTLRLDPNTFSDLSGADRIYVYGPDGATLWEGFLDNPGRLAGQDGLAMNVSAMGTVVLASDQARALPYIERNLDDWSQNQASAGATSATASVSDDPLATTGGDTDQGLLCQFNPGQPIPAGAVAQIGFSVLANAGMELGAVGMTIKSGKTDAGYRTDLVYSAGPGSSGTLTLGSNINTTPSSLVRYGGTGGLIPVGNNRVALQLRRSGTATNVTDDDTWSWFYDLAVVARRMDASGTLLSAAAMQAQGGASFVRADYIVADLVGRVLTACDPNNVTIESTSFAIDQLCYAEPVTSADVLDDLELYESDFLWEFLGSTSAGYAFNYRAWPTTVRYEFSTEDGYDSPGADFDLCNRIVVRWTDRKGADRTTIVTAASATNVVLPGNNPSPSVISPALRELEDAGRIRDAEVITLPEGRGSATNAQRIGMQVLTAKSNPPKAATLTVRRPVRDLLRSCWAMPYELEPGYLGIVREVGDVLRVTEVDVDDAAGVALVTLGEPVLEEDQRIARLEKVARRSS